MSTLMEKSTIQSTTLSLELQKSLERNPGGVVLSERRNGKRAKMDLPSLDRAVSTKMAMLPLDTVPKGSSRMKRKFDVVGNLSGNDSKMLPDMPPWPVVEVCSVNVVDMVRGKMEEE